MRNIFLLIFIFTVSANAYADLASEVKAQEEQNATIPGKGVAMTEKVENFKVGKTTYGEVTNELNGLFIAKNIKSNGDGTTLVSFTGDLLRKYKLSGESELVFGKPHKIKADLIFDKNEILVSKKLKKF